MSASRKELEDAARRMLRQRCLWRETCDVGDRARKDCESALAPTADPAPPKTFQRVNGTREEVWAGVAQKTRAGLRREDLMETCTGRKRRIVSRRASEQAKQRAGGFNKKSAQ